MYPTPTVLPETTLSPNNLPIQRTSYIGRVAEIAQVKTLLADQRFVMLTGVGGCGKTRLALQVAHDLTSAASHNGAGDHKGSLLWFVDGVWRVDLAPLTDASGLTQVVADALSVREAPGEPILTTLVNTLARKHLLIVLDNCEHLISACADLVEHLLARCPTVHILATSRQPLGMAAEKVIALGGLDAAEASLLFVDRASRLLWGFEQTTTNAPAIDTICHTLEGLPLALELAAARVSALSINDIVQRLGQSMRLLSRGLSPDARHTTMTAALEWSYTLLTEAEQTLLRRLAVFVGSFSLEAAIAVHEGGPTEGQAAEINVNPFGSPSHASSMTLDLLSELVDRSLLTMITDVNGQTRYRLLEPVRQFAWEKLNATQETYHVGRRHALFYNDLARRTETELHGPQGALWHTLLDLEYNNLQAAINWAVDHHEVVIELQIGLGVASNWHARGRLSQAYTVLDTALQRAGSVPPPLRGRALHHLSILAKAVGNFAQSEAIDKDLLELYRSLDDVNVMAAVLGSMAIRALWRAQVDHAVSLCQEALTLALRLDDKRRVAVNLSNLGALATHQRAFEPAKIYLTESETLFRKINNIRGISVALTTQAELALATQDLVQADHLASQSLALTRQHDFRTGQIQSLLTLGKVRRARGELAQALLQYKEAMGLCLAQASKPEQILCLEGVAGILVDVGLFERAAHIFAASDALRSTIGLQLLPLDAETHERDVATLRGRLDAFTHTQADLMGRDMDWEEVGAYVLATEFVTGPEIKQDVVVSKTQVSRRTLDVKPASPAPTNTLRFLAFGPAIVYRQDDPVTEKEWSYVKPKELLYFLLSHPDATKEQIGLALWPDASTYQLQGRLNDAFYRLRKVLGQRNAILKSEGRYYLNPTLAYWYDVALFETLAKQIKNTPTLSLTTLEQAAALYNGDFLSDLPPADWIQLRRDDLQRKYLRVLMALGQRYMDETRLDDAIETYQRVVTLDGFLEEAHRQVIRCYARQGERGLALRQYHSMSRRLWQELSIQPDKETLTLYERLLQGLDL